MAFHGGGKRAGRSALFVIGAHRSACDEAARDRGCCALIGVAVLAIGVIDAGVTAIKSPRTRLTSSIPLLLAWLLKERDGLGRSSGRVSAVVNTTC
jgi:hypothetical protein